MPEVHEAARASCIEHLRDSLTACRNEAVFLAHHPRKMQRIFAEQIRLHLERAQALVKKLEP